MFCFDKFKEDHQYLFEFSQKLNECNDTELLCLFKNLKLDQDEIIFHKIIQMIANFEKYRPHSFEFISNFLLNISDDLTNKLSEDQILNIFKYNSQSMLDFLFDQKIISQRKKEESSTENSIYTSFYLQNLESKIEDEYSSNDKSKPGEEEAKMKYKTILKIIEDDDISLFQNYISRTNENINCDLAAQIDFLNKSNSFERQCSKFIEYSAFFGSIQIFKFLWMNNVNLTENLFPLSIIGGNFEIIHLVESKILSDPAYKEKLDLIIEKSATAAIFCFRHELLEYLCESYSVKFEYSALYQSLVSYNLPDLLLIVESDPEILNSFSDDLHETIFHNPNHFAQCDFIKFILSSYLCYKGEKQIHINIDTKDVIIFIEFFGWNFIINFLNYTPLHNAVVANNIEYVDVLLQFQDIDVNSQSLKVDTPLHFAACFNYVDIVKLLIKHKNINPNAIGCVSLVL